MKKPIPDSASDDLAARYQIVGGRLTDLSVAEVDPLLLTMLFGWAATAVQPEFLENALIRRVAETTGRPEEEIRKEVAVMAEQLTPEMLLTCLERATTRALQYAVQRNSSPEGTAASSPETHN